MNLRRAATTQFTVRKPYGVIKTLSITAPPRGRSAPCAPAAAELWEFRMQRFVPSALGMLMASAAFMQTAAAADMPRLYAAPAPAQGLYNWTGFYIGGQAGYGWGTFDVNPRASDIDGWFFGG